VLLLWHITKGNSVNVKTCRAHFVALPEAAGTTNTTDGVTTKEWFQVSVDEEKLEEVMQTKKQSKSKPGRKTIHRRMP